jgi:RHS repeat-associated protein/uncharacterized repeat protein (TIGR01451 family)
MAALLIPLSPQRARADTTTSKIAVHVTIGSFTINPNLNLTFGVDKSTAIPGDALSYSGQVTHTGITACLPGTFSAQNTGVATATIANFFDEIDEWDPNQLKWVPLVGYVNTRTAYVPIVTPLISTGITLAATSVPANGVTYPSSGDPIIGTTIAPNSTAVWNGSACLTLTAAQLQTLANATSLRVQGHMEDTPGDPSGEPWTDNAQCPNPFQSGYLNAKNVAVTVTPPSGSAVQITSATVPAFSSLAPGASASYATSYQVPVPAAKGASETDTAYFTRLTPLEGATLTATAAVRADGPTGSVTASAPPATTTEHLPIVGIFKTGPTNADVGTTATYPLTLKNSGGATASKLAVTDTLPGGATGTVSGVPSTLAGGASVAAQASYAIPPSQPAGTLTDTAAVTWQDANGNGYGPVSSSYTTAINNSLIGATLSLSAKPVGLILTGNVQTLQATLLNRFSFPVANRAVSFSVTGVNPTTGTATTDSKGVAVFSYTGANVGSDLVQAAVPSTSPALQSNTGNVSWVALTRPVSTSPVQGNFYNLNFGYSIAINPSYTPAFGQTFPNIAFNPPPGIVPNNVSGLGVYSHPFTDVTTDVNGNYSGTIVAQGNGHTAGAGDMYAFQVSFTGTFNVAAAGNVAFQIHTAGAMIFGIGGGATRVSGQLYNPPSAMPFTGYPVMGDRNKDFPIAPVNMVVNFPAAGSYPYEIDYAPCCNQDSLTMRAVAYAADPSGLAVYTGYAETHPGGPGGGFTPTPWQGSPNTNFMGVLGPFSWDNGAIRVANPGSSAVVLDDVSLDVGNKHFDQWGSNLTVPAGGSLIVTQMADQSMDTSDINVPSCTLYGTIPIVHVTLNGVVRNYPDMSQVINTGGSDLANCGFANESQAWAPLSYSPVDVGPIAPVATIALTPATVAGDTVGQPQVFTAAAMDATGRPIPNLPVTLSVFGPNGGQVNGTTDAGGLVNLSYVGINSGTDNVQVTATIANTRTVSNVTVVSWTTPPGPSPGTPGPPPPAITAPSPADGSTVTKPVPISATITPPSGQTITSWSVSYQDLDPSAPVTLATGTGTPPATLATFDPTLLPNDTYGITISATASGGGTQTLTTSVIVFGNLKLGRYVTTYQDLNVPVSGYQMQLRRTYDGIDKRVGDFGVGWKVELVNFRTSTNRALGAGGWTQYNSLCGVGLCVTAFKSSAPHYVVVVFPDGHDEIFDFTPTGGTNVFVGGGSAFTARPGTTSTLQADGNGTLGYSFDGNLYDGGGMPFNPPRFRLTTHDGHSLLLDRTTGLVSETDRNGNALTVDATGVHSSSGGSITLTRDAANANRITSATGPSGEKLAYSYSSAGDLATSTDPNGNVTTYSYDANHDLLSATGPSQTRPLSTLTYDPAGRLTSITDGNGNTTQVTSNVAGQQQTVTDAAGRLTTVYTLDDIGDLVRQDQVFDGKTLTSTATYDPVGRPLSRTDPLGHTWTGSYDSNGNLLQLAGPLAHTIRLAYDQFGAPLSFSDPIGNGTGYGYDASGNLTTFTNALGQVETYGYDAKGNLTSRTDAVNHRWTYAVDANGNRTSMTDPLGNVTTYAYDSSGRLIDTKDPLNSDTSSSYDATGNLVSTKDALSQTTSMSYDALGRLTSRTDVAGKTTNYTYDGNNKLTSSKDPLGRVTSYGYDADGRLLMVTDPAGGVTTYAYDGSGRLASQKDPIGRVTSYAYDNGGRLLSTTMPNGGVYTYADDADGHQTGVTDPLNHTTTTAYDADGNVVSTVDPLGNTTKDTVDALGRQVQLTDALGQLASTIYDAAGRLGSVADPLGHVTTYGYDAAGNRTSVTDPLGHSTTYSVDAAGRTVASTDALSRKTQYGYDALGRLTTTTPPSGMTTAYGYDALGHQTSVTDPLGNAARSAYDAAGQRISSTDPLNHTTAYGYDPAGRLTTITDALGGKVTISFDAAGQQTSIVNPRGDTTRFTYDPLGNIATRTDPAGKVTTMTYDVAGRLATTLDARGVSVSYGYDAGNHQTSTTFPGGAISQAYDALGRRTTVTDPTGTTAFAYDATSDVTAVAAPQGTVSYAYDAANRRTSMTLPGARTLSYRYDAANQLTGLTDWFNQSTTITYTPDGLRSVMTRPAGLKTSYGYDLADRLTSVNNDGPSGPLKDFGYTLDAAGNRTSVSSAAGTESYTLDPLNRLTQVAYPNGDKVSYTYDAAGNRLTQVVNGVTTNYSYNAAGQLQTVGATAYSYDSDGNLIGAGADSFSWDWAGRLNGATVGSTTSSYTYDGDGTRVAAKVGSASTTNYLWDRQGSLALLLDDGTHGYIQSGGVQEQLDGGGTSTATYPLPDALGSVRGLSNSNGALSGSADYDAFGAVRFRSGGPSAFGFTGQQIDPTSLLFLRARYLNTGVARFLSTDNVFPSAPGTQGYSPYSYVANNPTTKVDPSGLFALEAPSYIPSQQGRPGLSALQKALIVAGVAIVLAIATAADCYFHLEPLVRINACHAPARKSDKDKTTATSPSPKDEATPTPKPIEAPTPTPTPDVHLWRAGANTDPNFTPRPQDNTVTPAPQNDTVGYPQNGLSTFDTKSASCDASPGSNKTQGLDIKKVTIIPDLHVMPDVSIAGHFFLQGSTEDRHLQWANTRPGLLLKPATNGPDVLTTALRLTIVERDASCP